MLEIQTIDSHTGGEPTRTVIGGGPDLGSGSLRKRLEVFRSDFDHIRKAVILEPRGSDVLVGALLCEPADSSCVAGVIFFNNTDYLHMCGHGMIGLVVTLAHLGRIVPGEHRIETPVGVVTATLLEDNRVRFRNVPSWRYRTNVSIDVEGHGPVVGDIAWGGNWFFLIADHGQDVQAENCRHLTDFAMNVRHALEAAQITGKDGALIDHIELFAPPSDPETADSRNFVLCPGGAYDRSPCGTGTSAKLACLAADGKVKPGQTWKQQSIVGSVFEGRYEVSSEKHEASGDIGPLITPTIVGSAWITAETTLLLHTDDPFATGIPS